jgi:hypothetical protein
VKQTLLSAIAPAPSNHPFILLTGIQLTTESYPSPMTPTDAKTNIHEPKIPLVLDNTVGNNAIDAPTKFVSHQIVRQRKHALLYSQNYRPCRSRKDLPGISYALRATNRLANH